MVATRLPCNSSRRGPWRWPWGSRWRSEWRSAIPVFSFHPWFFFSFKGLTNEVFSLISLTMLGHAKKTTDTTFTIFYNQVCFVNSISSMSLGWVKKTTKTTFTTSNNAFDKPCAEPSSLEFCHGEKGYHEMERFALDFPADCPGEAFLFISRFLAMLYI